MEDDGKKKKVQQMNSAEASGSDDLKNMTLEELNALLAEVLDHEDYIRAIAIRDEIKTRKGE
jgi:protein-arginine kinase activator protein McsA